MTVTTRVFSGFAIALLLSIVLFFVARISINNINTGIDKLSSQSVPTLISAANLSKSVLTSELVLKQLITTDKLSEAVLLSERFAEVQEINQESIINLGTQLNNLPDFMALFEQVEKANIQLYDVANKGIEQLLNVLKQIETTAKLVREFSDMGDESLSFAYDLESMAEEQQTVDDLSRFVELIEITVETANQAFKSNYTFEIMGIRKEVTDYLKDISTLLIKLQSSYELKGSDELVAMVDNIEQFKEALSGDNSAINSKINSLKNFSKVKNEFELSATQANTTQTLLIDLNHKIEKYTDNVKQNALNIVEDSQFTLIVLVFFIVIISLGMSFLVTRSIRDPLKQVVEKLKVAATGDMTVQFDNKRKDELGEMADCMQQLVNSLRNALQEIANNSQLLASTAEETSTIADMSFTSANDQQQQMETMSSSISQMTQTVSSVSESVNVTLSQVEQVNMQAKQGESVLLENTDSIIQLGKTIEESAKVIQSLNDDTMNISSVLSEIKGIAEQTNLLALNAAIEAARAGEQGRGFAVVADEVRSLASRTQDSTQEIQSAIEHLVEGAQRSVESMKESQNSSQTCVVGSNKVKDMLHNIVESIQSIRDMSQQIATASEQQTIAAQSQLTSVNDINDITEQTTVRARENQEASQQLAEMAETQRALLNRFKT